MRPGTEKLAAGSERAAGRVLLRDGIIMIGIAALLFGVLEVGVRTLAPQDVDTIFIQGGSLGLHDEVLGHLNRPNSHTVVRGPEFEAEYKINEQGFRDESIYAPRAPEGMTRILLLGDSFTFGAGSDYEEIWPVILERKLRDAGHQVEVIKAGVPAFDTRSETLYLERLTGLYHPDLVIMTFLSNDLFTNRPIATPDNPTAGGDELRDAGVVKTSDKKSELHSLTLAKRLVMLSDRLYISLYLMTQRRAFFVMPPADILNRQISVTKALFARAQDSCRETGCELMVLSLPQQFQVIASSRGVREGIDPHYIDQAFLEMARERGMQWLALLPTLAEAYRAHGEDLYFRYDGHLNPAGNEVVGSIVAGVVGDWLSVRTASQLEQKLPKLLQSGRAGEQGRRSGRI